MARSVMREWERAKGEMANLTVESRKSTSPLRVLATADAGRAWYSAISQTSNSLIEELAAMPAVEAGAILDAAISTLDERQGALQTFGL